MLDAFQDRQKELQDAGIADDTAHNQAWDDVDYDQRYRTYLGNDTDAQAALDRIRTWLAQGLDIALVCYENTDQKRCHRTLLRDRLDS